MAIDKATVHGIARLARIKIDEAEAESLVGELSNILDWVEQLGEVDTEGVQPMTSVVEMRLPLRADAVTDGGKPDDIVQNAPDKAHGFFVVPKVVE
ncbi:MAG: Asp-tRNA(Asn)/Glu-tRNA(Gln) amidotransferase subunit GatC [Kiloniellales bacterium]